MIYIIVGGLSFERSVNTTNKMVYKSNILVAIFKGLAKLRNIAMETLFLVAFPGVAKLAGNKQNVFAAPVAKGGNIVLESK